VQNTELVLVKIIIDNSTDQVSMSNLYIFQG